jgi:hypothetical protein
MCVHPVRRRFLGRERGRRKDERDKTDEAGKAKKNAKKNMNRRKGGEGEGRARQGG